MLASSFPALLVPIIGLFFPAIAMAAFFLYLEQESVE